MKGFYSLFSDSAKELSKLRTLTTTGILMAIAIVLRSTSIQITMDLRISFAFLAIAVIGMLFGPVVGGMAGLGTDFIGFLFDRTGQPYYPPLTLVAILSGVIYGLFLYRKDIKSKFFFVKICISRIIVVVFCNICLNSYLLYTGFVNKSFELFSSDGWGSFFAWIVAKQRITKNVLQLPFDLVLMCALLPIAYISFKRISKSYATR